MTIPILPFSPPSEATLPGAAPDGVPAGLPFSAVLGSVLGAPATTARPASASAPLPALMALLLGGHAAAVPFGGAARPMLPGTDTLDAALAEPGSLSPDELALLAAALGDGRTDAARLRGTSRRPADPTDPLNARGITAPQLRALLHDQLSPEARGALRHLLDAYDAHVIDLLPQTPVDKDAGGDAVQPSASAPAPVGTQMEPAVLPGGLPLPPTPAIVPSVELFPRAGGDVLRGGAAAAPRAVARVVHAAFPDANPLDVRRELEALVPELRTRLERLVDRMRNEFGYRVEVVETVRSQARQDALFSQGRTTPGPVVTWTKASPHLEGRAVDVRIDGGYRDLPAFQRLARVARELGLRTLWPRDPGHVELPVESTIHPRVPEAAGTRVGIDRPAIAAAAAPPVTGPAMTPAATRAAPPVPAPPALASFPVTTAVTSDRPGTAEGMPNAVPWSAPTPEARPFVASPADAGTPEEARVAAGDIDSAPRLSPAAPAPRPSPEAMARVANVAQVAFVAATARVADVARVAPVGGTMAASELVATRGTAVRASADERVESLTDSSNATTALAAVMATQSSTITAPSAARASNAVDRAIAALNAHLARGEARGDAPADDRGAERDLVAAVRERIEATGLRGRAGDVPEIIHSSAAAARDDVPSTSMAERIAHAMDARDAMAERPLSSVLLRLDHPEGGEDRIRIDLRGHSVTATLDVRDPIAADRMSAHAPELSRALAQHGLDPEQVTIRTVRPDSSFASASGAITDRDGIRTSTSSSTSGGDLSHQGRDARDQPRPHDHPHGDGRPRPRRDSRGTR